MKYCIPYFLNNGSYCISGSSSPPFPPFPGQSRDHTPTPSILLDQTRTRTRTKTRTKTGAKSRVNILRAPGSPEPSVNVKYSTVAAREMRGRDRRSGVHHHHHQFSPISPGYINQTLTITLESQPAKNPEDWCSRQYSPSTMWMKFTMDRANGNCVAATFLSLFKIRCFQRSVAWTLHTPRVI